MEDDFLSSLTPQDWFNGSYGGNQPFLDLVMPGLQQEKEFNQQMFLQSYQNWWNSESEKMKRSIEAGISPFAAAGNIAGDAAPSVGGVPSSAVGASAKSAETLSNAALGAVNAATGGAASLADAAFKSNTLESSISELKASAAKQLSEAGLSKWQTESIIQQLPLLNDNLLADYSLKLATIDKTFAEYENFKAEHDNIIAHYDEIISNTNYLNNAAEYQSVVSLKTSEEMRWIKADNDFWSQHGYRRDDSIHQALIHAKTNGQDPSFIGDIVSSYEAGVTKAVEKVKAETSFDYRPSNPWEILASDIQMIVDGDSKFRQLIESGISSGKELLSKISSSPYSSEFDEMYQDYKDALRSQYRALEYSYHEIVSMHD